MSQNGTKNIKDLKEGKKEFAKWHDVNYVSGELTEIRQETTVWGY
jgi:thiamine monophosphate kinase